MRVSSGLVHKILFFLTVTCAVIVLAIIIPLQSLREEKLKWTIAIFFLTLEMICAHVGREHSWQISLFINKHLETIETKFKAFTLIKRNKGRNK